MNRKLTGNNLEKTFNRLSEILPWGSRHTLVVSPVGLAIAFSKKQSEVRSDTLSQQS